MDTPVLADSHSLALCVHWMLFRRLTQNNGQKRQMARKSKKNPFCPIALIMMTEAFKIILSLYVQSLKIQSYVIFAFYHKFVR